MTQRQFATALVLVGFGVAMFGTALVYLPLAIVITGLGLVFFGMTAIQVDKP